MKTEHQGEHYVKMEVGIYNPIISIYSYTPMNVLNYQKLRKSNVIFFLLLFFLYKIRVQEGRTGPVWGVGTSARREDRREGCRRVNMVEVLRTHV
jgi:hypothetical protein